jgi:hypothetical protein
MTTQRAVPGLLIGVLVTAALVSVAVTLVGLGRDPVPQVARGPDPPSVADPLPEVEAAAVLASWDADRAAAWSAGDVRRLRSLYTDGSIAGDQDVAMLRRWLDRGLVVDGLRTQVLGLREVRRSTDRWVLTVTDRVVDGVARGETTQRLPADTPTTRTVTLRLVDDRWLVSSVR